MREVISVHLGQTGVGTGLALWDCLELEQGGQDTSRDCLELEQGGDDRSRDTGVFFHEAEDGRQVARAVFGDLDPQSLGARRMGEDRSTLSWGLIPLLIPSSPYRWLPGSLCSGREDSASNYVRGRLALAPHLLPR